MASYLQIEGISKSYGTKVLFHDIAFNINEGDKIALVAPNGTGKTSLMRILSGKEKSDSGGRILFLKDIRIAFLEQEYDYDPEKDILSQILQSGEGTEEQLAERRLNVRKLLGNFHLDDPGKKMKELSGGEIKRVALTDLLSRDADFLLMDEPTNHLDIEAVEFLEKTLKDARRTLLMVTHDRYFLDRVCNQVMELDRGKAWVYKGDYENFLEKRQQRIDQYNAETDRVRNILRRELEWMRSTPCARSGKAQYRIDSFYKLQERAQDVRRETQLRLDGVGEGARRLGTKIIDCDHAGYAIDGKVLLKDFSYRFQRGEKVGIVGANGVGKTTFLRLLTGELEPETGRIERGESMQVGWYRQEGIRFKDEDTVLDIVPDGPLLDRFLFPHEMRNTAVGRLSGGEKRRLYLLSILRSQPNVLILDEPTNDLDIVTLNILEEYLASYPGTVLMVSHDRHFLDRLAGHLLIFTGGGAVKDFVGPFSEYRELVRRMNQENRPKETPAPQRPRHEAKKGLSYKEQKELEQLEADIARLETEKAALEEQLSSGMLDYNALEESSRRHAAVTRELDDKTVRWLELSERS